MKAVTMILAWAASAAALAIDPGAILGTWSTEDRQGNRDSIVEIAQHGEEYVGRVVWIKYDVYPENDPKGMAGQTLVDRENPDPALRERPILGLSIVSGLRFDGREWNNGRLYSPRHGESYSAKAWLEDANTLKVRGYVGVPFLGQTVTWRRAELPSQ